ncbi:diaminopimelate epimerase [Paraburkholderia sp. BR14263]|uniref:diaminopimelate epimerase n=1 Tax=unclassified Paraburkholderia TaxID=2615204 RepID=UPI0034CD5EEA
MDNEPMSPFDVSTGRPFLKIHGLGNDFVLIDGRQTPFNVDASSITRICDRHIGVGGDQLLVIESASGPDATARLRIFNVDGMEVQTCLNATRCAAWVLLTELGLRAVKIETLGGIIQAMSRSDGQVSLKVPAPSWEWQDIPLVSPSNGGPLAIESGPLRSPMAVSMGNPHLVFLVADFDSVDIPAYAPAVQNHPMLLEGANVGVAELVAADRIKLAVWERPGILTLACGSGACAAALVVRRLKLSTSSSFTVHMPGGDLAVEVLPDETTLLTGPVEVPFTGRLLI